MDKLSLDGLNFETICLEVDRKILTITLNRPEKKNAMNNVMMDELNYALAYACLLYTSPSPRDDVISRMPSSA